MEAPKFGDEAYNIQKALEAVSVASEGSWTDKQGFNFRLYHVSSINQQIRDLSNSLGNLANELSQLISNMTNDLSNGE